MSESGRRSQANARIWILATGERFAFDAVVREQHAQDISVPQEPVEDGFVISDHAFAQPARLSIEAAISDTPLRPTTADPFASSISRSVKAYDLIKKLAKAAEPFTVVTGLERYTNMLITGLSADQEASTSGGLLFRAELLQVTIRSTRTVTVPPRKAGKPARVAAKKTDAGSQDAPDADAATRKSALLGIVGVSSVEGQAIANSNPNLSPGIQQLLGPGSALP